MFYYLYVFSSFLRWEQKQILLLCYVLRCEDTDSGLTVP